MPKKIKQPLNTTVFNGELGLKIKWNPKYADNMNERMRYVQSVIDNEVLKHMKPYIPRVTGTLMESATWGTVIGSGKIIQEQPYARYLYYGEIYGPNLPIDDSGKINFTPGANIVEWKSPKQKFATGRPLKYNTAHNPLAGKKWFERMKTDNIDKIRGSAQKALGKAGSVK
ncbi:MAG: hypothetical protein J6L91_07925 [Clostridia bacterium]|nr:hypothetical protein [Clostridia bacterium]